MTEETLDKTCGLTRQTLDALTSVFIRHSRLTKVILYGSRAKGTFRKGSDVDLTLIGDQLTHADLLEIETQIDDLLLPYKVDISLYHFVDNENLREHIDRVGVVLYHRETS